jgi:hypothetical protein
VDIIAVIREEISPHLKTLAEIEHAASGDPEAAVQLVARFVASLIRDGANTNELREIIARLDRIESNQEKTVSGLTDLNANIAALQAEWTTFLADMTTALSNEDSDAAVEAAAQLVAQQTAALQSADPVTGTPGSTQTNPSA